MRSVSSEAGTCVKRDDWAGWKYAPTISGSSTPDGTPALLMAPITLPPGPERFARVKDDLERDLAVRRHRRRSGPEREQCPDMLSQCWVRSELAVTRDDAR